MDAERDNANGSGEKVHAPRGKCLTGAIIKLIAEKYAALKPIGASKLMGHLPADIKRSALSDILTLLRKGESAASIIARRAANRQKAGRPKVSDVQVGRIKEMMDANNTSKVNSQRKVAKKVGISVGSVNKVLKTRLKIAPLKKVRTTKNGDATLKKREKVANEIGNLKAVLKGLQQRVVRTMRNKKK